MSGYHTFWSVSLIVRLDDSGALHLRDVSSRGSGRYYPGPAEFI